MFLSVKQTNWKVRSGGLAVSLDFSKKFKSCLRRRYTLAWKCEQAHKISKELAEKHQETMCSHLGGIYVWSFPMRTLTIFVSLLLRFCAWCILLTCRWRWSGLLTRLPILAISLSWFHQLSWKEKQQWKSLKRLHWLFSTFFGHLKSFSLDQFIINWLAGTQWRHMQLEWI